ncbi:MAG: septum formation initiator family protein [Clostridia bacterium]|nr:septum formation initiator family protein [Clostridia bacterium]
MRRRVKPRFWVFMIAVTLFVFLVSFGVMRLRYEQGARQLTQARQERDDMAIRVSLLTDRLSFAQTDDYVIRTARDELGMIMPGEVRYINGSR